MHQVIEPNIKAIIFDWHGVLDKVEFEGLMNLLMSFTSKTPVQLDEELHDIERQYAKGDLATELFWKQVQKQLELTGDQLQQAKSYIVSIDLNNELWKLLPQLSKKYQLAILSDCPQDKVDSIRKNIDLSIFGTAHFSAEEHLLKSEPAFFQNVTTELQVDFRECLFIDDRRKNMIIPEALGIQTHVFNGSLSFLLSLTNED
jgi:FMN phosphatase YigB (HAD superfamily)